MRAGERSSLARPGFHCARLHRANLLLRRCSTMAYNGSSPAARRDDPPQGFGRRFGRVRFSNQHHVRKYKSSCYRGGMDQGLALQRTRHPGGTAHRTGARRRDVRYFGRAKLRGREREWPRRCRGSWQTLQRVQGRSLRYRSRCVLDVPGRWQACTQHRPDFLPRRSVSIEAAFQSES